MFTLDNFNQLPHSQLYDEVKPLALEYLNDRPKDEYEFKDDRGKSYTAEEGIAEVTNNTEIGIEFVNEFLIILQGVIDKKQAHES
jgi:hypothetical protein